MATHKTLPNDASVDDFLQRSLPEAARLDDARALVRLLGAVTGEPPVMWGTSMVGFGRYHYRYASGREGDFFVAGLAPRKSDFSVYLLADDGRQAGLRARLGPHRMGRSCLSLRRLADVDTAVLCQLVAGSVAELRRRYPSD